MHLIKNYETHIRVYHYIQCIHENKNILNFALAYVYILYFIIALFILIKTHACLFLRKLCGYFNDVNKAKVVKFFAL